MSEKLGTCDREGTPHEKRAGYAGCVNWRELPAEYKAICPTCGERKAFRGMRFRAGKVRKNWQKLGPKFYWCRDPWHDEATALAQPEPLARRSMPDWINGGREALGMVGDMLKAIPIHNAQGWNRYDTDNQHVLHIWADGKSYDIRIPKDEHLQFVDAQSGPDWAERVKQAWQTLEHFIDYNFPPSPHAGFCGPESGCDATCMERVNLGDAIRTVRAALIREEAKEK